jgi:hypothetical protein
MTPLHEGKSVWVYYALRRCLAERKPVIWYFKALCYLFVEEGVYEMPVDFQTAELKPFIWTLVDSDEAPGGSTLSSPAQHSTFCYILHRSMR